MIVLAQDQKPDNQIRRGFSDWALQMLVDWLRQQAQLQRRYYRTIFLRLIRYNLCFDQFAKGDIWRLDHIAKRRCQLASPIMTFDTS